MNNTKAKFILRLGISIKLFQQRLEFLSKCRDFFIVPNCCNLNLNRSIHNHNKITKQLQTQLLVFIIKGCKCALKKENKRWRRITAGEILPPWITEKIEISERKFAVKFERKLRFLAEKQNINIHTLKENFVNRATVAPSAEIKTVFSLGPKFVGGQWKRPKLELIADAESSLLNNPQRDNIIANIAKSIRHKQIYARSDNWNNNIEKTKQFLKNNNIICLKEDKGNRFVLLDYKEKMTTEIVKLEFNLVENFNNKLNREKFISTILRAHKDKGISRAEYYRIYPSATRPPRMFANSKLHKPQEPLRLMLDFGGVHYFETAKLVNQWLVDCVGFGDFTIKSSFEFVRRIKDILIDQNFVTAAMDVTELYGSINRKWSIEIIHKELINKHCPNERMNFILSFLNWLDNNIFTTFEGRWYDMKEGWPMGLPLSGIISSIFLNFFEKHTIVKHTANVAGLIYVRYVDDVFMAAPKNVIVNIQNELQLQSKLIINTTWENEGQKLKYLDLLVHRENRDLHYSMIVKPLEIRGFTHPKSMSPTAHKFAGLNAFLFRNQNLCKFEADRKTNIAIYIKDLLSVGFSYRSIAKKIKQFHSKLIANHKNKDKPQITLPYIPKVSQQIIKTLTGEFKVGFRTPPNSNRLINNSKDRTDPSQTPQVIYSMSCPQAGCKAIYYGETKATVHNRAAQHLYTYRRAKKNSDNFSIFLEHEKQTGHVFEPGNPRIVCPETNDCKRKIKEAYFIVCDNNSINRRDTCFSISKKWSN